SFVAKPPHGQVFFTRIRALEPAFDPRGPYPAATENLFEFSAPAVYCSGFIFTIYTLNGMHMDFLRHDFLYLIPVLGLLGLFVTWMKSSWIVKQDPGEAKMKELAGYIARGAMAFLRAEWKVLSYYVVIAALLLGWSGTLVETSSWIIAISFIIGCVTSAFAGYIGMNIATKANVRTTQAARTSL